MYYEVIIIGAGPAGIGSASILSKNQKSFIVLEARNRIGGRTLSANLDGTIVDLGASWIHTYSQ